MGRPELLYIPHSPWSERARWALQHHGIEHRAREYVTMIEEPLLRARLGRWRGNVTVPVLFDGSDVAEDSFAIAQWADAKGSAAPLFVAGDEALMRDYNERADAMLDAGRARTTARVAADRVALQESLPPPLDKLGAVGVPVAKLGAAFIEHKYAMTRETLDEHREVLRRGLDHLREALAGRDHLLGDRFTFADLTMALGLTFIAPPPPAPLGPRSRPLWSEPDLAEDYADLLQWRDQIMNRHWLT